MSLADSMPEIDALIFAHVGDTAEIGTETVAGVFYRRYRQIESPDGSVMGLDLSFDCQVNASVLALTEGDTITIKNEEYQFTRRLPERGDESGLVTLQLATPIA